MDLTTIFDMLDKILDLITDVIFIYLFISSNK